jgi:uncharacterized protein (DUF1501 family)
MKTNDKLQSRRALLNLGVSSLAGAGLLASLEEAASATTTASATGDRALVCVYLFGGECGWDLPPIAELQAFERAGALRVLRNVSSGLRGQAVPSTPGEETAQRYSALRFLPNGFATPEWAARLAALGPVNGDGAFTFRNGLSLVSTDGRVWEGSQFENPSLRRAMSEVRALRTKFPGSSVGRQLEDASRLLRASGRLGLKHPVFLCTAGGFTSGARRSGTLNQRYQELGQALAAFYEATLELGIERQVTTYTDAEFPTGISGHREARGKRLILGGSTVQGELAAGAYHASLARWHGVSSIDLQKLFPEFATTGLGLVV